MSVEFPPCPASLKGIQHYLKTAQEHDGRDIVVSYWCRLYALQLGLKMSTHQPDETKLLMAIMDWLETIKKSNADNDSIVNEVAAQAHLENYALKLFLYADKQDRESNFGKNVVKAFYTSGMLYDTMQTFGELTEEAAQNRKYAKWKAAYIHNCLKAGETPVPGPMANNSEDGEEEGAAGGEAPPPAQPPAEQSPDQTTPETPQEPSPTGSGGFVQPPQSHLDAAEVLKNPEVLPSPPVEEEKNPGGFVPFSPQPQAMPSYIPPQADITVTPEMMTKAQKYCKYAASALNFDDPKSAIDNLHKALKILTTGQE